MPSDTAPATVSAIEAAVMNLRSDDRRIAEFQASGTDTRLMYLYGHRDARHDAVEAIRPLVTALAERAERAEATIAEVLKMKALAFQVELPVGEQGDFQYLIFGERNDADERADECVERGHERPMVEPLYPLPDCLVVRKP